MTDNEQPTLELNATKMSRKAASDPVIAPGCCVIETQGVIVRINCCGDRPTCDHFAGVFGGSVVSYTQGTNCTPGQPCN